eukprot:31366-Pelagococcus_subviridis.AAC.4
MSSSPSGERPAESSPSGIVAPRPSRGVPRASSRSPPSVMTRREPALSLPPRAAKGGTRARGRRRRASRVTIPPRA